MENNQRDFFDTMPSKTSYVFGLVSGIAILMIASFFLGFPNSNTESNKANTASTRFAAEPAAAVAAPTIAPPPAARPPAGDPPPITEEDHIRGDKNAPLTLIEYSDYECPFCKRFHPTMTQMMDEFGDSGKIKWVYRHFPLSFHDPLATAEATAAECANELAGNDAFWSMSDMIFERSTSNGRGLQVSQLSDFAEELGLNRSAFDTCLNSGKYDEHIRQDIAGGSAAGVTGTPGSFFVDADGNAQLISGAVPYGQIKALIEASL
ncbi:MAG: thioredoxin domain-containing protein [bacterium]|nr:thioredoxin domain-containing protein [bacterium]